MSEKPTKYPGEAEERSYRVTVLVDGAPYWTDAVDARSNEEAVAVAYSLAVITILKRQQHTGTPAPPPEQMTLPEMAEQHPPAEI